MDPLNERLTNIEKRLEALESLQELHQPLSEVPPPKKQLRLLPQ